MAIEETADGPRFTGLNRLVERVDQWCRDHLGSRAPERLIDPEGEGVYLRDFPTFVQWKAARELGLTYYYEAQWENVWMREGADGDWYPTRWRTSDGLKLPRWAPTLYAYWTPIPASTPKPESG